jgi:hypothetical protein
VKWILTQLLKALAWGVFLLGLGGLLVVSPAIGLLVMSSFVPVLMVGAAAAGALSDWRDGRRPSTWIAGRGRASLVRQDDFGKLWTLRPGPDGEAVRVVEVVNATPEPDGSYRRYFLQVPPSVRTAREAIAWTFGLTKKVYVPAVES